MKMRIEIGDCFELIKDLPDNSVDLVITSPPYSDIVNYGKQVSIKKPTEYVDWILPLFNEIWRVLKPSGSFILNINDNCSGGYRNTYIYEMIYRADKETKIKLYDTYIWHKRNGIPNGSIKRFRNMTEYIFHFCKDSKQIKFYMDRVLQEQTDISKKRLEYNWSDNLPVSVDNGVKITKRMRFQKKVINGVQEHIYKERIQPDKVRPDNVFRFANAGASRDNTIKHPAPFHKELPLFFINLLTDENDLVLDTFSGIGTTGVACKELNRNYIGFELNEKYADFSLERFNKL